MYTYLNICPICRIKCDFRNNRRLQKDLTKASAELHTPEYEQWKTTSAVHTVAVFPTHRECSSNPAEGTGQHGCRCGPILRRRRQSNEKTENRGRRDDHGEGFLLALVAGVWLCYNVLSFAFLREEELTWGANRSKPSHVNASLVRSSSISGTAATEFV